MSFIKCKYLELPPWKLEAKELIEFESGIRVHKLFIPSYINRIRTCFLLLNDDEKKRANNYLHQKDSQRFIIARGMLKILASQYLGIPSVEVEITIGANKKPFIKSQSSLKLDYNISHSGNWIVMAFGIGSIGIDVEQIQKEFNFESLLPVCFSSSEQSFIQNNSNSSELFYRLWTRKESFVKATSIGLVETLPQLICLDGESELLNYFSLGQSWETWSFPLDHEHVASLSFVEGKKNILFIEQDIAI
ncbi:MAG: hypothetical protein CFE25_14395 [Chitinophagaceae bacterium BSSC1]|nr:MAG: hypothetical protein CFE25_14395 [Chitinophagaceae bacterium BSSC1]